MNVNNVKLDFVCGNRSQFPIEEKPEIAFCGKSNVGKSSLINSLINRKALARTSGQPGKTATINFYNVEDLVYLVDFPGYGYAKASKSSREKWGELIESYLVNRKLLQKIILLLDIRHEPNNNDIQMYNWIKYYKFDIIIVATKADKVSKNEAYRNISRIKKTLGIKEDIVIPFSAKTKAGKDEIWNEIDKIIIKEWFYEFIKI